MFFSFVCCQFLGREKKKPRKSTTGKKKKIKKPHVPHLTSLTRDPTFLKDPHRTTRCSLWQKQRSCVHRGVLPSPSSACSPSSLWALHSCGPGSPIGFVLVFLRLAVECWSLLITVFHLNLESVSDHKKPLARFLIDVFLSIKGARVFPSSSASHFWYLPAFPS